MSVSYHGKHSSQRSAAAQAAVSGRTDVRIINALLLLGIVTMVIGYLVMINRSATKGFMIRSIEQKISSLEDERKKLDLQALASQSMASIEDQVSTLGFVAVSDVEYLSGAANPVAVK
jgi:hypothetical protein